MTDTPQTPLRLLEKARKLTTLAGTLGADRQQIHEASRISQRTRELDDAVKLLSSAVKSARSLSALDPTFIWGEDEARARHAKFVVVLKRYPMPSDSVFNAAREDIKNFATALERNASRTWNSWKVKKRSEIQTSRIDTVDPEDQAEAIQIRDRLFKPGPYDDPTPTSIQFFQNDLHTLTEILKRAPDLPIELQDIFQTLNSAGVALSDIDDNQISLLRRTGTLGDRIILKVVH